MILDKFKLDGKVAIVTGASRDWGRQLAIGLAEAGADVACVDVLETDATRHIIEQLGRKRFRLTPIYLTPRVLMIFQHNC